MEPQLKEFQAAVSIHSLLSGDRPKRTKECAQLLGLKMTYAKVVVHRMVRRGLIKAVRGNGSDAGITKKSELSDVFISYGMPLDFKVEPLKPQKVVCDVCGEPDFISNEDRICDSCLEMTEVPQSSRIAKCGHETQRRYFSCEKCQPSLEDESLEFSLK